MTQQRRFARRNGAGARGANPEWGFWSPTLTAKDPAIPWLPLETPAAGGEQSGPVGLATETDTALALTGSKARTVGLATETDTALALTGARARAVGLASETDTAFALIGHKARTVGMASETDTALALGGAASGGASARPAFAAAYAAGFRRTLQSSFS